MSSKINEYVGLSTQDKPITVAGGQTIPSGSTYHDVDTGDEWIFYSNQWVLDLRKARAFKRSMTI